MKDVSSPINAEKQHYLTQNLISILIIVLLVVQTSILIFVMINLRFIRDIITSSGSLPQTNPSESLIGTQAPDFVLSNVDGNQMSLSEYTEQPVLLVFTSHQCPFCREMYHGLRQFLETDGNIRVMTLSVNSLAENLIFQDEFNLASYDNLSILAASRDVFTN